MNSEPPNSKPQLDPDNLKQWYDIYSTYAATLKNWYVVYGIGGIALIFTSDPLSNITAAERSRILILLLLAVFAQVILALIRKWNSWFIYYGKASKQTNKRYYSFLRVFSKWVWIDILLDLVSLLCFAYAGWRLLLTVGASCLLKG